MVTERGITLLNLHPDHQGEYLCTATNKAGSISASATLRVEVSEVTSVPRPVLIVGRYDLKDLTN